MNGGTSAVNKVPKILLVEQQMKNSARKAHIVPSSDFRAAAARTRVRVRTPAAVPRPRPLSRVWSGPGI